MKTYIKSLLAIATVALLGSSAWAASTYSLSMYTGSEESIALKSDDTSSRTIGSVTYSYTDGSSGCIDETKTSANFVDKTMPKSSGTAASFTVVAGQKAGTVTLQIRRNNTNKTILCNLTVTVVAPVEKTVEDGKTITLDTGVDLGDRYYYKLVADTPNYLTLDPATAKRESSGNSTGDLKVTGDRVTTSPVIVRLQTNKSKYSSSGTYTDVKVYSVTVKAKEPDPVKSVLFKDQKITFKKGAVTNWVDGELVLKFKADDEMTLPAKATADILVVGGGGAGVRGKSSTRNKYNGNGGNGGSATPATNRPMPAGSYNITVGAGALGVTSGSYDFEGGEDGGDSSIVAGTGVTDFSPLTADGGAAWDSGDENDSGTKDSDGTVANNGKTGAELPSNIDGDPSYVYGKKGIPPPSSEVANQFDGKDADEYGEGGQGSANGGNSGAGYQGIVIVRLKDITPAKDQDEAISLSVGGAAKTFTTIATADEWTYDISEGGDEVVNVTTTTDANGHLVATIAGIGDGTAIIEFFADGQHIKTVTATVSSETVVDSAANLPDELHVRIGEPQRYKLSSGTWNASDTKTSTTPADKYVKVTVEGDLLTIETTASYGTVGGTASSGWGTLTVKDSKGKSKEYKSSGSYKCFADPLYKEITIAVGEPFNFRCEYNKSQLSSSNQRYFARKTGGDYGDATGVTEVSLPSSKTQDAAASITGKKVGTETISIVRGNKETQEATATDSGSCLQYQYVVTVVNPLKPVAVPTAKTGLVYDYTEQTGVVAQTGYTLTGNTGVIASNYTATAKLDKGYCWSDDSTDDKSIPWSIACRPATVTVVSTNKLVGADEPEYQTTTTGFIAEDPTVLTWKAWRTNLVEEVGTYDVVFTQGEKYQGGYEITYVNGTLEIRAGKITVNGKGYDDVAAAFAALQAGGNATFNDQVKYDAFTFAQGTTLTVADGAWFVTNVLTIAETTVTNDISVAQKLTLAGDVTVGDDDHEAILAFAEIDNNDGAYKLTLTTNGVVQSATQLDDAVFAEVEHFHVAEKPIAGGFEYTLEATEFYVKYYDGDEVVHSNKFTILNYMTDLHIWNGDRKGLVLLGYKKENGEALEQSDAALHAYIKDEADKPGCDGEVKVFGTWVKPTITIHVKQGEGIFEVKDKDGESVDEDLELSAETTEVELTLEANVNLTVPVFKVVRGNVTNVTTKVETYAIADGDTLEFFAEEADETDPTVTDDDIKTALIESIDDPDPDVCEAAAKKVDDVVGTGAKQVSARDLATYINKNSVQSSQIADCDYVAASVKLDTDSLIDEDTEVEIAELVKAEGDALTFAVDIENDRVEVEAIKDMVEASSDLTAWKDHILEVKADFDDKKSMVTITPKDPTDKAFMRVVIPKDPGVK